MSEWDRTLTLAKLANYAAKKIEGYQGVCVLDSDIERINILKHIPVSEVWGIGRRLTTKLNVMGIKSAYDLACFDPMKAQQFFNVELERTVRELNGQACKQWDAIRADKKQIFSTRSVGTRITDLETLQQALSKHVGIVSAKARKQQSLCKVMMCFASSSPFDVIPVSSKAIHHFPYPTSDNRHYPDGETACRADV